MVSPLRRPVNLRSVALGLLGVILICGLAPYNDWAVNNTYLIGNYLPVGLLLFFLAFILLVNGPLSRLAPQRAFSSGEMAVSLGMVLVACAVAGSGLMRYLPAALIGVSYQPGVEPLYARVLRELNLPNWIFPTMHGTDPVARANDSVVQYYYNRTPSIGPTWLDHIRAVPWRAWFTPALTWGVMIAAFWGAILCIAAIVRRQWVENERLPFPIAQIYLSLIEPPEPGRMLNTLFRSRGFWIAAGLVFVIHGFNAMWQFDPKHWPKIPIGYDLTQILANPPWSFMEPETSGWAANTTSPGFKRNSLLFSIIGITFFLQTKVAFSLWFFYVFFQLERMFYGTWWQSEFSYGQQQDQQVGAMIPFALAMLWVGRAHWKLVIQQMFKRDPPQRERGRYLPYAVAGWGLVACLLVMVAWLIAAGASLIGAIVLVLLIITIMTVVARVVAETGLLFVQLGFPYWRPWVELLTPPLGIRTTGRSYFYHGLFSVIIGHDVRETLSVFSTHAIRVADDAAPEMQTDRRQGILFIGALALSLAVAYLVSGASMLYVEYNHAVTLDARQNTPLNKWAAEDGVKSYVLVQMDRYLPPQNGPNESHSRLGHFSFGFAVTAILSALRLRFESWPLHPVGLLIAYGWPIKNIWFSIFIGWLIKLLVVRFGGTDLFRAARNFFIGMIIGEAGAAATWLIVCLICNAMGVSYHAVHLFPE
jgi:hypothetical protein